MKRVALVLVSLAALLLAPTVFAGGPTGAMLANVDIDTVLGAVNYSGSNFDCGSFYPEMPGAWGGEFGEGAVTAHPNEVPYDVAGHCIFQWPSGFARHIELRVLDGIADDSFEVYVMNPGGDWVLVYSYSADPSTAEVWKVHHIYSFPAGKGQGSMIHMIIVPTNVGWSGFNTYGQLGVDYIRVYDK